MRTLLQIFLLCFIVIKAAFAQGPVLTPQVFASSGNFATAGNYSLSYTIGEPIVTTATTTGYILTQGFQQNDVKSNAVKETTFDDMTVKVYPNPAADNVNVLITSDKNVSGMQVKLFDVLGRNINVPVANYTEGNQRLITFNLSNLAATVYFIAVYDKAGNVSHTVKINKVNL